MYVRQIGRIRGRPESTAGKGRNGTLASTSRIVAELDL
jgi:hypothetical protein